MDIHLYVLFFWIQRLPRCILFPTRRSSDLLAQVKAHLIAKNRSRACTGAITFFNTMLVDMAHEGFILRSEEHTSELQSRGHLVCRLLLEKKKTPQKLINPLFVYSSVCI